MTFIATASSRLENTRTMKQQPSDRKKSTVRYFDWRALVRLAVHDMEQSGIKREPDDDFHYIGGLDLQGNPFIRVDLDPLKPSRRRKNDSRSGE
jgi:hypothetical protein